MRHAFCILALSTAAFAGPLEPSLVSREATWVVHIDAERAMTTELGKVVLDLATKGELPGRDELTGHLGFDPMANVLGLTFYGKSYDQDDGVAIITTTAEVEQAVGKLATAGLVGYSTDEEGGTRFHHWTQDGHAFHATVLPGATPAQRRVVLSGTRERLANALSIIRGQAPNRAEGDTLPDFSGTSVFVHATGIAQAVIPAKAATFRGLETVTIRMGQRDDAEGKGVLFADADLTTANDRRAVQVHNMIKGLLSTAEMMSEDNPDFAKVGELAASIGVTVEGAIVKVRASHSAPSAAALAREVFEHELAEPAPAPSTPATPTKEKPHGLE